jgi:hypothetical protein
MFSSTQNMFFGSWHSYSTCDLKATLAYKHNNFTKVAVTTQVIGMFEHYDSTLIQLFIWMAHHDHTIRHGEKPNVSNNVPFRRKRDFVVCFTMRLSDVKVVQGTIAPLIRAKCIAFVVLG